MRGVVFVMPFVVPLTTRLELNTELCDWLKYCLSLMQVAVLLRHVLRLLLMLAPVAPAVLGFLAEEELLLELLMALAVFGSLSRFSTAARDFMLAFWTTVGLLIR